MTSTPADAPRNAPDGPNSIPEDRRHITILAHQIAQDGTVAHHEALGQLADAAEAASLLPGAVGVLREVQAPDAARARAFLVIVRHWDRILAATHECAGFNRSFADLTAQWVIHQDLRPTGDIAQLARSATRLDELRLQTREQLLCSQ